MDLFGNAPQEKIARANWIRQGCEDFFELTGGAILTPARFGRVVKPLVEVHGWEPPVRTAWRYFVKVQELRFATPEYFARTYPDWVLKPKSPSAPLFTFREVRQGQRLRLVPDGPDAA
jgi:hypothetical protein